MNRERLKEIINNDLIQEWEAEIIKEIANDQNAISFVLIMLNAERSQNKSLITELNMQLSRAHLALEEPDINKDGFVQKQIHDFYKLGKIKHCYKMEGLE